MSKNSKPLGRKAYGSIPHLLGSRMGPSDHHCHSGQRDIACFRRRDQYDRIIVTEKLDGSNVAIAKHNGEIIALGRAGHLAETSPYLQHKYFAHWVAEHEHTFHEILTEGERINGEWLAQAHGTIYNLKHEPFVVFDMMKNDRRLPWNEIQARCNGKLELAHVIHDSNIPFMISDVMNYYDIHYSHHGVIPYLDANLNSRQQNDNTFLKIPKQIIEGAVWRVERKGNFDFMVKYVNPKKEDGKYLPEISGKDPIWHWTPSTWNIYR